NILRPESYHFWGLGSGILPELHPSLRSRKERVHGEGMQSTANFGFLGAHDAQLVRLGALAERYFREDPATAIFKLRQFAELLCNRVAAHHALYHGDGETFDDTLRRLSYDRVIPKEASDLFHALRKAGNKAAHEATGTHSDALSALKFARQLGIWFHRAYGK